MALVEKAGGVQRFDTLFSHSHALFHSVLDFSVLVEQVLQFMIITPFHILFLFLVFSFLLVHAMNYLSISPRVFFFSSRLRVSCVGYYVKYYELIGQNPWHCYFIEHVGSDAVNAVIKRIFSLPITTISSRNRRKRSRSRHATR